MALARNRACIGVGYEGRAMLVFALLGALMSAVGGVRARAGRQPIDWSRVALDSIGGGPMPAAEFSGRVVLARQYGVPVRLHRPV